MWHIKVVPVLN